MDMMDLVWQWKIILVWMFKGVCYRVSRWFGCRMTDDEAMESLYKIAEPNRLSFAQVWEDSRSVRQALAVKEGDHVLCISSGGDNAFALALDGPEKVLAVDFSPAQVALSELKKQAILHLEYEQFLYLMGVKGHENQQELSRQELYQTLIHSHLPGKVAKFWDERLDMLNEGLIHIGNIDNCMRMFARYVRPIAHSLKTVHMFLRNPEMQEKMYDNIIDTWLWRFVCKRYFGDVLLGKWAALYERCDIDFCQHVLSRISHIMRNVNISDNYFIEYILTGEVSGEFGLPDYMQPHNFAVLKQKIHTVEIIECDILQIMKDSHKKFDGINLSNIFDMIPMSKHDMYRKAVVESSAPGGKVCHWTYIPVSDQTKFIRSFSEQSVVNKTLSAHLFGKERAWFFQSFIVQSIGLKTLPA